MHRPRHADTFAEQALDRLADLHAESADVDLDEVRLHLLEVDRDAGFVQALGETPCARVVVGQPLDVVVERVDARRSDDPRLPHRAPELVLEAPCAQHPLGRACDDRSQRAAEALREADRDGVAVTGDRRRLLAARDSGVEEASSVDVQAQLELAAGLGHRGDLRERPDAAAGGVVRVLDRDDARRRHVSEVTAASGRAHLVGREPPCSRRERARHQPRMDRRPAQLGDQEMRVLLGEQLVAGLAEHPERDLVRHRRRRDEHRVFLAQRLRRESLELVDRRVLPQLLVADLRFGDRFAHGRRRLARRVGTEVDHRRIVSARSAGRRSSGSDP